MTDLDHEAVDEDVPEPKPEPEETGPTLIAVPLISELGEARPDPLDRRDAAAHLPGRARSREFAVRVRTGDDRLAHVVELRRRASAIITEESEAEATRTGHPVQGDDRLLLGRAIIRRVVGDHVRALHRDGAELWSRAQEQQYVQAVEDAVFGYGRLQPLLELPDVENIEIHGWDSVVVQYGDGRREQMPPIADSDEELVDAIRFLGQNSEPSRPFDDTHPTMTLALGERFRLHAIGFGLSYRPSVVIRQHILTDVSLADLVGRSDDAARGGRVPRRRHPGPQVDGDLR